nr:venom protein [Lampona murina]
MKIFFMLCLLIASVYCAEIPAKEEDVAMVENEFQGESRSGCNKKSCSRHCDCCGKYGYCRWDNKCIYEPRYSYICEHKKEDCPEIFDGYMLISC